MAFFPKGTKLQRYDEQELVFVDIPKLVVGNAPQGNQEYEDVTTHDSEGNRREYEPTLSDNEDLPFEIRWDPRIPLHLQLYQDQLAQTKLTWRLQLPQDAGEWTFSAYIQSLPIPLNHDRHILTSGTFKVTGLPTFDVPS
jgi:hypothetical protein